MPKFKLYLVVGDKKLQLGPLEGFSTLDEASKLACAMTNYPHKHLIALDFFSVSTHPDLKFHVEEVREPLVVVLEKVRFPSLTFLHGRWVIELEVFDPLAEKLFSIQKQNRPCKVTFEELP